MVDSKNGIEHKCPCCGYEVEWDWHDGGKFTKGDESFIQIQNICGETTTFLTDKPKNLVCYLIVKRLFCLDVLSVEQYLFNFGKHIKE